MVWGASGLALAQERGARAAVTDPASADADYALQGEYAGFVYVPGRGSQYAGLQVVARGDGQFDAVLYSGGLPAGGWWGGPKQKFNGSLADGILVVSGEGLRFEIADNLARAIDQTGRESGRLVKQVRTSTTMHLRPPPGAVVLFDGRPTDELPQANITPDGFLQAGVLTGRKVDAFRLHLEFRTPYMPQATGQARGNSGVYIQQRYEVQILDSFGLEGVENECGGLYRQTRPDVNMCLPPLTWQTYDIWFTPPAFADDGQTKTANARITVLHNGVPIHLHREITAKTGGGKAEGPDPLPINLQDHGNPVAFRNIWLVPGVGDEHYGLRPAVTYAPRDCGCRLLRWRRCR
jgi:hypothetical protein